MGAVRAPVSPAGPPEVHRRYTRGTSTPPAAGPGAQVQSTRVFLLGKRLRLNSAITGILYQKNAENLHSSIGNTLLNLMTNKGNFRHNRATTAIAYWCKREESRNLSSWTE